MSIPLSALFPLLSFSTLQPGVSCLNVRTGGISLFLLFSYLESHLDGFGGSVLPELFSLSSYTLSSLLFAID